MSSNGDAKIIITGAGGWLGTEYLESLLLVNGGKALQAKVVCLGSRERDITLSDGTTLEIQLLSSFNIKSEVEGLVHLAFLTRDKVAEMSAESYAHANLSITSSAIQIIENLKPRWVATVSSGAIFSTPGGPLENRLQDNPYGFTKRAEETLLIAACESVGANLAIGRLWGAMGRHMPINRAYAVSDFIEQAKSTGAIQVRAEHEVYRRYCLASEFMNVLTQTAAANRFVSFDSGGEVIELGTLAKEIASKTSAKVLPRRQNSENKADDYFPQGDTFEQLAKEFGVTLTGIEGQIDQTLLSHGIK
jgi:nucleoside-diphosphate-sugar epimerase